MSTLPKLTPGPCSEMRLLHTTELRGHYFFSGKVPKYAILSYTWGADEVTFQDMEKQSLARKIGFKKIQDYC
jgi:hypothetical protein